MIRKRSARLSLPVVVALVWGVFSGHLQAAAAGFEALRQRAEQWEREKQWVKACDAWADLLAKDRSQGDVKDHFLVCLRHARQQERHRDQVFHQRVLHQETNVALKIYEEVLGKIRAYYVDKEKTDWASLFHQGLEELRLALEEDLFQREFLAHAKKEAVTGFEKQLRKNRVKKNSIPDFQETQKEVLAVALAAQKSLGLPPAVTILEFACGACNGLDEHSFYLTPGNLSELYASLEGEFVGIGIDVEVLGQKPVISQVLPGSPAAQAGIKVQDRILQIDRKPVLNWSKEAVLEKLKGEAGALIELEIQSPDDLTARILKLERQPLAVPSVVNVKMLRGGIGYLQILAFQKTTLQELDDAVVRLKMQGMKALVLDLRGNPGGLFEAAVQIAERFLAAGVIVSTQSQARLHHKIYRANNVNALTVPLVVLVDGETASAAEVVAGALKENQRAILVGQTTFGKGSIQEVMELKTVPAGIRITLAKFFSPTGQAYNGAGITPDIFVERTSMNFEERQLQTAIDQAKTLLLMQ